MVEKTVEQFKRIYLNLHKVGSRNSILLLGKPGIGKCLRGDTIVATPELGKYLKDMQVGDEILGMKNGRVIKGVVTDLYRTWQPVVCVKTEHTEIHGSPLHWFYTNNGWVRAKHLLKTKNILYLSPIGLMEYEQNRAELSGGDSRRRRVNFSKIRQEIKRRKLLDFSTIRHIEYIEGIDRLVDRKRVSHENETRQTLSEVRLAQQNSLCNNSYRKKVGENIDRLATLFNSEKTSSRDSAGMDKREETRESFTPKKEGLHGLSDRVILEVETLELREERITEIFRESEGETLYDISTSLGNYIANGLVVHNTESVIQASREVAKLLGKEFIEYDDGVLDKIVENPKKYYVFVDFALTTTEPSDLVGLPRDHNGYVVYKQLGWAKALSLCAGCLFLDEITNVQRMDVQSVMMKILLEHLIGFARLNSDVTVIAAGNKTGKLVTTLPEPVLAGRIIKLDIKPPKIEEWIEYMNEFYGDEYDKRVAIFLKKNGERFIEEITDEEVERYTVFASPRSWTKLAALSHKLQEEDLEAVAEGLVGSSASLFMAWTRVKIPTLQELKADLGMWIRREGGLTIDQKYFMTLELCSVDASKIFKEYSDVMNMLASKDREFLMLSFMMMNTGKRKQIAMEAKLKYPDVFQVLLKSSLMVVRFSKGESD